MTYKVILQASK